MAKQKLPTEEELNKYNKLCSLAFSRRVGAPINVKLDAFEIHGHITKSKVFGANVSIVSPDSVGTVEVPSKVIIKEYIPSIGTSEDNDISDYEFRKERAILDQEVHINREGEIIRVYPLLYSRDVPECEREKIIIREYIPEKNLEQIAEKQKKEGRGIKWEAIAGSPAISEALYSIVLFQVQSPSLSSILKERNLLKFGTPQEAKSYEITVGLPPTSALLKKEAGAEKGSGLAGTKPAGALKIEHIIGIADIKADAMLGKTLKARVKEIVGTCVSLGMNVEGKPAKVIMKELESGIYDSKIKAKKITLTAEENSAWESEKQAAIRQAEQLEKAVAAAAAAAQAAATPAEGAAPAEGAVAKPEGRKKAIS